MKEKLIIGTRASPLAMWQALWVQERLGALYPNCVVELVKIKTTGDKILDVALAKVGDKGLFTKELEVALVAGTIDLAVHSTKDLPTALPEGLGIGAICTREDNRDVLVLRQGLDYSSVMDLPAGAVVGTSSLRRIAQICHCRPDLTIKDVRGNLNTRLKKLDSGEYDALVLAAAGVLRLGWEERISEYLSYDLCLPAVGQGAVGIEIRMNDAEVAGMIAGLDHQPTSLAIRAERALLSYLEGGCQIPIGSWGRIEGAELVLDGLVASLDGKQVLREQLRAPVGADPTELGVAVAKKLVLGGADKILKQINESMR